MKEIDIPSHSGDLAATLFEGTKQDTILIIASATGVKQAYYQKFAQFIAGNDISVITFDYNGIGRSLKRPITELEIDAADWGRQDIESVIQYVISNYPNSKKVILGHSIGGQLIGLSKSSHQLDKVILVAAQSGYWKLWTGMSRLKMWFNWFVLFPALLRTFGYLNSKKFSGMENLPKRVADQWRTWGKHPDYIMSDKSIEQTHYDNIKVSLSAFSIEDDEYAPPGSVEWMTGQYHNAKTKSTQLKPADFQVSKIGHFGVFKERFEKTIWQQLLDEILN